MGWGLKNGCFLVWLGLENLGCGNQQFELCDVDSTPWEFSENVLVVVVVKFTQHRGIGTTLFLLNYMLTYIITNLRARVTQHIGV